MSLNANGTVNAIINTIGETQIPSPDLKKEFKFGSAVTSLGDLNGDGNVDIAVGAEDYDDSGTATRGGAVYVIFLDANADVINYEKTNGKSTEFQVFDRIRTDDDFGASLAATDIDGDGIVDLLAGAPGDGDGNKISEDWGSLWVMFLYADGTLKGVQQISAFHGNLGSQASFTEYDWFGSAVDVLDIIGDTTIIMVGANADGGGGRPGKAHILYIDENGLVLQRTEINSTSLSGVLDDGDYFGSAISAAGDLDGDCRVDIVVGAKGDDNDSNPSTTNAADQGAIYILYLEEMLAAPRLSNPSPETGDNNTETPDLFIYPNPVTDFTTIEFEVGEEDSLVSIEIVNVAGEVVIVPVRDTNYLKGNHTILLDSSSLLPGAYFFKAQIGQQLQMLKMIVAK